MAAAALVALFVIDLHLSDRPALTTGEVNGIAGSQVKAGISKLQSAPPTAATVYAAARGGLVLVEASHGASGGGELGSGIVVDTQGSILTALHVVQGATAIRVTFADGSTSTASLQSSEPSHDIAVLKPARLASTAVPEVLGGRAEIGEAAFVVANPLGLEASLSAGVVSGLGRTFPLAKGRTLKGMIQFDAAVNPGSSGGPLLNAQGQVIGIVTGLANAAGTNEFAGIGFAVPISTAGGGAGVPPQ